MGYKKNSTEKKIITNTQPSNSELQKQPLHVFLNFCKIHMKTSVPKRLKRNKCLYLFLLENINWIDNYSD